jgi:signal peptidase II
MYFILMLLLLIVDQLTKFWAASTFPLNGQGQTIGLGFYFTYVRNTGAAFGIFQEGTFLLAMLSTVVSVALFLFLLLRAKTLPVVQRYALASILAGAVGNMIDRFRLQYVVDFIHFKLPNFDFAVFNVADSCVVVGAALLILSSLFTPKHPKANSERGSLSETEFFKRVE